MVAHCSQKLPMELCLDILTNYLDLDAYRQGKWKAQPAFAINRHIRQKALSNLYGQRDLIFELPCFVPHKLREDDWPSALIIRDSLGTFVRRFAPGFLCSRVALSSVLEHRNLELCPFHLFRSIKIDVHSPAPEDPAELLTTWNRLRWIVQMLAMSRDGLPHVSIRFLDGPGRRWRRKGKFRCSHEDFEDLAVTRDGSSSDISILLGALSSLRRARGIDFQGPPNALLDKEYALMLNWLQTSAIKTCKWGDYLHPVWHDWHFIAWLESCELRFHRLLHCLDTPIAPFLRLEQLASMTHFKKEQLMLQSETNRSFPHRYDVVDLMVQLISGAFVLCPRRPNNPCNCVTQYFCNYDTQCYPAICDSKWQYNYWVARRRLKEAKVISDLSKMNDVEGELVVNEDAIYIGQEKTEFATLPNDLFILKKRDRDTFSPFESDSNDSDDSGESDESVENAPTYPRYWDENRC